MKFLEKLLFILFPNLLLKGTPWEKEWGHQEKGGFLISSRVFFSLAAVVYIIHYHTVDKSEGLAPSELWFNYRYGMAGVALLGLIYYCVPAVFKAKYYKIPYMLACAVFCYFQTMTILWYPKVPYLYSFGFVLISAMLLRTTILNSLLYAVSVLALIWPILIEAGNSPAMIFSASLVTSVFIVFIRSKYLADVNLFLVTQKNFEQQRKMIEINLEFTRQIQAFLPQEISKRLNHYIQVKRMNTVQSIDEVLRPRKVEIAALFSDIRGFTKGSNDLNGFVSKSMLPNVKGATNLIEAYKGIPRKIGDLIFAYYDHEEVEVNLINATRSAMELAKFNEIMNEDLPAEIRIKRFFLIATGEAVVGNLSGYDSAIEITAIGRPVNLLSRVDEVTKHEKIKTLIEDGSIILTPEAKDTLTRAFPTVELIELDLSKNSISIRDFSEIQSIFVFPRSHYNFRLLFSENTIDQPQRVVA